MKKKITNILGALALATTLGATSATATTPNVTVQETRIPKAERQIWEVTIQYYTALGKDLPTNGEALNNYGSLGAAMDNLHELRFNNGLIQRANGRLENGIGLPVIRYGKMFPKNRELGNTAGYNPLALDPLQFQSILNLYDCIPRDQYNKIIGQITSAFDSTKTELTLQYNNCKGENKELRVQLRAKGRELESALTRTENLQRIVRMDQAEIDKFKNANQPDTSRVTLDQIVTDSDRLYPKNPIESRDYGNDITNYNLKSEHKLENSLEISAYTAPGVGLNANLGHTTLGLGVFRADKNKESNYETRTIINVPAPDFRTVYTEEESTQEETKQMAFLASLGYNFSRRFSLLAGAEIALRETSGQQTNTIEHFIDNARISKVSEIVPTEGKTETEVYPAFGLRYGPGRLSLEGFYSTSGQFVGGVTYRIGGSK